MTFYIKKITFAEIDFMLSNQDLFCHYVSSIESIPFTYFVI